MKTEASNVGKGIVTDINVEGLFVKETLAKDTLAQKKKPVIKAPKFGEVDLWNIRRQARGRKNLLRRVF